MKPPSAGDWLVRARLWARDWTPPVIWRGLKRLKTRAERPEWEYVAERWPAEQVDPRHKGWNVEGVLAAYQAKWPDFLEALRGPRPLGLSAEAIRPDAIDLDYHNAVMCFAYVLAKTAHPQAALSMLDWGGGLGHYYHLGRALLPEVTLDYHCKDVPVLADHGREVTPQGTFYTDEACLARPYDLVLASASLHYSPDWTATARGLARATRRSLFVTRLPVVFHSKPFVFVQRPYRYGYNTEYLGWCLNRDEFVETVRQSGMRLVREFVTGEAPPIRGAPEQCQYRGYLFQPAAYRVDG